MKNEDFSGLIISIPDTGLSFFVTAWSLGLETCEQSSHASPEEARHIDCCSDFSTMPPVRTPGRLAWGVPQPGNGSKEVSLLDDTVWRLHHITHHTKPASSFRLTQSVWCTQGMWGACSLREGEETHWTHLKPKLRSSREGELFWLRHVLILLSVGERRVPF